RPSSSSTSSITATPTSSRCRRARVRTPASGSRSRTDPGERRKQQLRQLRERRDLRDLPREPLGEQGGDGLADVAVARAEEVNGEGAEVVEERGQLVLRLEEAEVGEQEQHAPLELGLRGELVVHEPQRGVDARAAGRAELEQLAGDLVEIAGLCEAL